jgi:hypothetical protein
MTLSKREDAVGRVATTIPMLGSAACHRTLLGRDHVVAQRCIIEGGSPSRMAVEVTGIPFEMVAFEYGDGARR